MKRKFVIEKLKLPIPTHWGSEKSYKYNVQEWHSRDGTDWFYCGYGRYCCTKIETYMYMLNTILGYDYVLKKCRILKK